MKVGIKAIKFGIDQLIIFYPEFCRHSQFIGVDNIVDSWSKMFISMDYDYEQAEQDFKQSIFELIKFHRDTPRFSDILEGMRELHKQHELKEIKQNRINEK